MELLNAIKQLSNMAVECLAIQVNDAECESKSYITISLDDAKNIIILLSTAIKDGD